jgi:hypothetical protein
MNMIKSLLAIPFCILIVLGTISSASAEFFVTQVTTNSKEDITPRFSNNGDMVWVGQGIFSQEIFVQDGVTRLVTQLTNNFYFDNNPQINDHGDVVWVQWNEAEVDMSIMLYTKSAPVIKITRLDPPDDPAVMDSDSRPRINNSRQVVWRGFDGNYNQIMFYDGSSPAFPVTNNNLNNNAHRLNNNGDIVWTAGSPFTGMTDIWLYDNGSGARAITTTSETPEFSPQINDSGDVVWYGWSGATMSSGNFEIYYHTRTDGTTSPVTSNAYDSMNPSINAMGQIAWMADISTSNTELYFRDGLNGSDVNITNNPEDDSDFSLNDNGWIVWAMGMGSINNDDNQIWVYDGTSTLQQVTSNVAYDNIDPQINNSNDLAWSGTGGIGTLLTDYEIFSATTNAFCTPPVAGSCDDNNICTTDGYDVTMPGGICPCINTPNIVPCDDGDGCTVGDTCSGGACQAGGPMDCSDGQTCTDDVCSAGVCSNPENCTPPATCNAAGDCELTACVPQSCDDGNVCTDDSNDTTTPGPGPCTCINTNNTATCDDGDGCTVDDACSGGACVSGAPMDCSDGQTCTDDICTAGVCSNPENCTPPATCNAAGDCELSLCSAPANGCEDNNVCTANDWDATALGGICPCVNTPTANGTACDDSDSCTVNDVCSNGVCQPGAPRDCDDGNICTLGACFPSHPGGCKYWEYRPPCSDGNACTIGDQCSGGVCQPGVQKDCGDGMTCTNDVCDTSTGVCSNPENCVSPQVCNAAGDCEDPACIAPANSCDDSNVCTNNDWDATVLGGICPCVNTPIANGTSCDDGDPCTLDDVCSNSVCQPGTPKNCDDGNVCTLETCLPYEPGGCKYWEYSPPCSDGNACTIGERCSGGACQPGVQMDCSDGMACTDDVCTAGVCSNPENCTPPATCNAASECESLACTAPANGCEDSNACTNNDWDVTVMGGICPCVNTPIANGTNCDDGDPCTLDDVCSNSVCQPGTPKNCDDGNICTLETCFPYEPGGCKYWEYSPLCSDGNACTIGDRCSGGVCQSGAQMDCSDGMVCTDDVCTAGVCSNLENCTPPATCSAAGDCE